MPLNDQSCTGDSGRPISCEESVISSGLIVFASLPVPDLVAGDVTISQKVCVRFSIRFYEQLVILLKRTKFIPQFDGKILQSIFFEGHTKGF